MQTDDTIQVTITYDSERRSMKIYYNGKLMAGMSGKIAEMRYKAIKKQLEYCNNLVNVAKNSSNGHKEKTKSI